MSSGGTSELTDRVGKNNWVLLSWNPNRNDWPAVCPQMRWVPTIRVWKQVSVPTTWRIHRACTVSVPELRGVSVLSGDFLPFAERRRRWSDSRSLQTEHHETEFMQSQLVILLLSSSSLILTSPTDILLIYTRSHLFSRCVWLKCGPREINRHLIEAEWRKSSLRSTNKDRKDFRLQLES